MQLTIVSLNYNGSEDTIKLLKSLDDQADKDFEIIVIDNTSEETDFSNLQAGTKALALNMQIIRNDENLGFSGGNNVGIRHALETGSDWIVLLNNDTWVERDFIERLKGILEPKNAVVGIPILEDDRTAYCGKLEWLKPTLKHVYQLTSLPAYQLYAIGGAMAIHKSVFEKIGPVRDKTTPAKGGSSADHAFRAGRTSNGMDEKYFLYFEDADFSIRAKRAGFNITVANPPAGKLSVHHHISSSTKKLGSSLLLQYHYRNALYFNLKNGPWYIKLFVWPWSWLIVIKQLVKITTKQNVKESKAILSGVLDFYKNKYGKI